MPTGTNVLEEWKVVRRSHSEIAVVGLGCILPDAFSPQQFWENNINGHTALRPLDVHHRWDWNVFYSDDRKQSDKTYTITAGAIQGYEFDWRKFRIPPSEAQSSNPMQFMILDAGTQALENVKIIPKQTTGIYIGSIGSGWQKDTCLQIHKDAMLHSLRTSSHFQALPSESQELLLQSVVGRIDQHLKSAAEENMIVHSLASVACGRIAQHFDLKGPHVSIDAGYSSSLAALEVGIRSLQEGSVDLSLVGGASEILTPLNMIAFAKLGGLSRSLVRPFDAQADGTLLGEGTAMFALKRLEDAIRDKEHIYAVIKGVGSSSDGQGKSLLAPDTRGQIIAMKRAYEDAGIEPQSIRYVECHATGTQVGDTSEIKALAHFHQAAADEWIALGSVKANVGHLGAAAGAAGLLRTILTLYHRQIPPQIQYQTPNPQLELSNTPFVIPTRPTALQPQHGSAEPRAAISSFGFGGTNYHAVLEAYSRQNTVVDTSRPSSYEPEPIAIVGMAGMFPDASDVQTFWANLLEGKDAVTHFPRERFDMELYYDPSGKDPKKTYTTKGGFLTPVKHKPTHWKIPPSSASYVDEAHYLALRTAEQALAQAGYDPDSWNRGNISVMLGFLPYQNKKLFADVRVNYQEIHLMIEQVFCEHASIVPADARQHILEEARNRFFEKLPEVTEDTLQGYLGSLTAGRITKHFDFHGAQLATDAACCSAHLAFLVAVQSLRHKKSDAVLVGGVNADMSPEFYVGGCGIQALSADAIRPFDAHADGFVPGEGAGFFVLRRLSDAERDGQPILAVIRSVAATSDGKSGSILAPSLEGEATAMINALQQAGISPDEVDYVECHGTGTAMGDATEVEALSIAYGKERRKPLRIGSVKSNIGHLLAAAAVPALMKTICAIREHIIPASINLEVLIPTVVEMNGTIKVVTATEAWVTKNGQPRRAGVSGFGLGGANSHIIVEEYIPIPMQQKPPIVVTDRSIHPLPIATVLGASLGDCTEQLLSLAHELVTASENRYLSRLADIQLAISSAKKEGHRVAIVAANAPELLRKAKLLQSAIRKGLAPDFLRQQGIFAAKVEEPLQVAVVFPGQGVQYPNMLRDIMAHFPEVAAFMNKVDEEYRKLCGKTLTSTFLTDAPDRFSQSDEDIHCAVFAVNCALFTLLRSYGLEFDAVIGQSAGELAALVATNTLALPDALRIVRERTLSVLALKQEDPGKMLTVYCSAESARHFLNRVNGYCEISADNSPGMCIISGETQAILALRSLFEQSGIQSEVLPVSHGYHSQMIADARTSYRQTLDTCTFAPPAARVISTITGNELHNMPVQHFPKLLESQFVEPVRLRQAIETAYEQGVRLFIECGPKRAVSTYISETLSEKDVCVQATMHPKVGELEQLYRALACLFVHGKGQLTPQNQHEKKVGIEMNSNNKEQTTTQTADQATLLFLQSMRDMIDAFLQSQLGARTSEPVIQAAAVRPEATKPAVEMKVEIAEVPQPVQNQVQQQVQKPVQRDPGEVRDEVTEVLLSLMVQRTGYPKDMLELDLDLEADLGIDTVKQVAILADARHHFGLEQEEGFRVRDYHTLHKIITYFTARLTGAQSSPTPVAAFFR